MSSPMRCTASWSLTARSLSPSHPSLSQAVKERTILVSGASKTYAMTGWRIGFAAAGREIVQVMSNYLSHSLSGTCSIAQAAAEEAFGGSQAEIEAMRRAFEVRRDYLYQRMSAIPGVHPVRSEATFYMLMNLEELIGRTLYGVEIRDADDFANVFLREGLVAVVPCTGFGAPHYVRWSFAVSMENIKEGLDRLGEIPTQRLSGDSMTECDSRLPEGKPAVWRSGAVCPGTVEMDGSGWRPGGGGLWGLPAPLERQELGPPRAGPIFWRNGESTSCALDPVGKEFLPHPLSLDCCRSGVGFLSAYLACGLQDQRLMARPPARAGGRKWFC